MAVLYQQLCNTLAWTRQVLKGKDGFQTRLNLVLPQDGRKRVEQITMAEQTPNPLPTHLSRRSRIPFTRARGRVAMVAGIAIIPCNRCDGNAQGLPTRVPLRVGAAPG